MASQQRNVKSLGGAVGGAYEHMDKMPSNTLKVKHSLYFPAIALIKCHVSFVAMCEFNIFSVYLYSILCDRVVNIGHVENLNPLVNVLSLPSLSLWGFQVIPDYHSGTCICALPSLPCI